MCLGFIIEHPSGLRRPRLARQLDEGVCGLALGRPQFLAALALVPVVVVRTEQGRRANLAVGLLLPMRAFDGRSAYPAPDFERVVLAAVLWAAGRAL